MITMTPEHFERMQALFRETIRRRPEERAAFLKKAVADPALCADVEALLAADENPLSQLQTAAGPLSLVPASGGAIQTNHTAATVRLPHPPDEQSLRRVGPYRVLREVGRGGMGTVYLAERDDVAKKVALKLVRGGLPSPEMRQRFLRERRILARLEHPHIARLLDAGMTDDEAPYFAMEYVEGETLTAYCDRRRLSINARLALFQHVCEAVQYAHQNLVIHRDLKPGNMMVDGNGMVKLLDFGIAKLLEDEEDELVTQTGVRLMTPTYAAPEQVRGETVTTATDVYALGIVLYELLTGHRPYDVQGRSPGEIEHVICEVEPPKPSTAVLRTRTEEATQTLSPETVSEVRATQPDRLRRRLSGDLDVICLKALQKEPSRRYASAEAFLEDIKRHLAGLPVQARPSTPAYRVRKFVRRHRGAVMASLVLFFLVAVLTTGFTVRLAQERDRARLEAQKKERVANFMVDLFGAADPYADERADTMSVRTLLARGAQHVEDELAGEPEIQATLLNEIGHVYTNLDLYAEAVAVLRPALALQRTAHGPRHLDVAESMELLGRALYEQGNYAAADSLFAEALALQRDLLGTDAVQLLKTLGSLAELRRAQGDYEAAEALYGEHLAMNRKVRPDDLLAISESLNNLGNVLRDLGRPDEAEAHYREALALKRERLGEDHPDYATSLNNLAGILRLSGTYAEAEALYRQVVAIHTETQAGEVDRAIALNNLAMALRDQEKYDEAEAAFRESLALSRAALGEAHPYVAHFTGNLARLRELQGHYDEAEVLYHQVLAMNRARHGTAHPAVAGTLNSLATLFRKQAGYREAEALYREALAIFSERLPAGHVNTAGVQNNLAECLILMQRYAEAEPLLLGSHPLIEATFGAEHDATQKSIQRLVQLYDAWGRPEEARPWRTRLNPDRG